ncbi:MAG TPA: MBL fold metallo-hydrolase [Spirochaetota bacterium]|nr:MBL fold metallo-hydrolase [Spirochaetota bacterium]HQO38867.1 MBL fold metallo-hydrolase [Spirochaetota bacterium]
MKIHALKGYINTLYIAEYEHGLLLMDGASPADLDVIEYFCKIRLKRPVPDIKLAVVTHMHPDHSGCAPLLRKKYGTKIAAYKNIDKWYSGPTGWIQHKLDCLMAQLVAAKQKTKIRQVFSRRITGPDFLMNDGDKLPLFPDWQVIYTPGHTAHDMAIYHSGKKTLYCGDSIVEVKGRFNLPLPVIFKDRMKDSYHRLGLLKCKEIIPAHGKIIDTSLHPELFNDMEKLLETPPNKLRRRVHYFSVWSPDIWKPAVRRLLF